MKALCGYCHDLLRMGIERANLTGESCRGKHQQGRQQKEGVVADSLRLPSWCCKNGGALVGSGEKRKSSWRGLRETAPPALPGISPGASEVLPSRNFRSLKANALWVPAAAAISFLSQLVTSVRTYPLQGARVLERKAPSLLFITKQPQGTDRVFLVSWGTASCLPVTRNPFTCS